MASPKPSTDTFSSTDKAPADFEGDITTNNEIPTPATLRRIEDCPILDQDGRSIPFKNLYTGPNVARRVLVIFIRHFYCGNCQEYLRTLSSSITPSALLALPTPTSLCIVGHGTPSLIPMYAATTSCPFPIYADPTKTLYSELGMLRTLNLGVRPEYQRKQLISMMVSSFLQSVKMLGSGRALKGGNYHQVGGEFLFESKDLSTPLGTPGDEGKRLGGTGGAAGEEEGDEKVVTWCHRMRNTRDHAEVPEVREVLGLDGEGVPGGNKKRWSRAVLERKGTGISAARRSESFRRKVEGLQT